MLSEKDLLKRLILLKRKPELAQILPQEELVSLMLQVMTAFQTLQKAIETNKIKGDKGDPATPLVAGVDYPSFEQINSVLSDALSDYGTKYQNLQNELQKAILKASELTNGKDAEITEELIEEVAELASSLIELPDFDELVDTKITASPEAIRNALELLKDDERLDASAVKGLENYIKTVQVNGGTIGKGQVYGFIRQAVADGTIPSGGGTGVVETIVAGTGISVDSTDPANPIISATGGGGSAEWIVVSSSRTAVLDEQYSNVATATYTDPTPAEGKGFIVLVRNGTATVGGTGYSTAGTLIYRVFHSGSWANYVYQVSSTFAPASHTHTASQITDFDTEVSNNTDVAANTAARHSAVTLAGTPNYITIAGQVITRALIDLTSHVTGRLPFANLSTLSAHQVLGRAGSGTGDVAGITAGNDTILARNGSGNVDFQTPATIRSMLNVADGATANLGDVVGPASATNNAVPLFDGTSGKLIKDSSLTWDESLKTLDTDGGIVKVVNVEFFDGSPSTGVLGISSLSDNRNYSLPDQSGTIALMSDILGVEEVQDAVGNILLNTDDVEFTYDDVSPNISAIIPPTHITSKTAKTTLDGAEQVLIFDTASSQLRQVTTQQIADLGAGGGGLTEEEVRAIARRYAIIF